jgi:sialic acid synthase SpsE
MGASLVEKHLTLDRTMAGPDHAASLEPAAFGAMTAAIRAVEAAVGDGVKRPAAAELGVAAVARRSLHWTRDAAAGAVVGEADLVALRPATGVSPARLRDIVDRRTARAVAAGTPVLADDLEADR